MVKGLKKFKEYFSNFNENYVIIGGTACEIFLQDTDMLPRATDDIDIILVVEKMTPEFGKQFWNFINDGNYKTRQRKRI
jgi:predicted nucleotidyltransferase